MVSAHARIGGTDHDVSPPWLDHYAQALIAFGALLRIAQYTFNRSLWLDEASLAINIVGRSYLQLMRPLAAAQAAPLGFLIIEKAVTCILGTSEYALRLFPLVTGVLSLWVFYRVARRVLSPTACLFALALFATLDPLIYFSSEFKQYSSDVLAALLLLWMAVIVERRRFDVVALLLSMGAGAAAIWFSHPAVFVLAGIGSVWLTAQLRRRNWRGALRVAGMGAVWLASFILSYLLTLSKVIANPELQSFWANKFVLEWTLPGLAFLNSYFLLVIPVVAAWFLLRCRDERCAMLVLPACFTFVAAVLHTYPFTGRLLLFLLPLGILLLARLMMPLAAQLNLKVRGIEIALPAALLVPFFVTSGYRLFVPRVREEARAEIAWMSRRFQPGDLCYVYYAAETTVGYYAPRFGLNSTCIVSVSSRGNRDRYVEDLHRIPKGHRVWVLFSHIYHDYHDAHDERLFFLSELDRMGRRLIFHDGIGASVYLYDLTAPPLDGTIEESRTRTPPLPKPFVVNGVQVKGAER